MNYLDNRPYPYDLMLITAIGSGNEELKNLIDKISKFAENEVIIDKKHSKNNVNLAYKIAGEKKANYLNLRFSTIKKNISSIKKILKEKFIIRSLLINLSTEKHAKLKPTQKNMTGEDSLDSED